MEWPAVVTAISTALLVLVVTGLAIGILFVLRDFTALLNRLDAMTGLLETEVRPAIRSAREAVDDGTKMLHSVKSEVDGLTDLSRDLRRRILKSADRIEDRLLDLDALVEVAQGELEETVLDVAAALRTARRGKSIVRSVRRVIRGRRR